MRFRTQHNGGFFCALQQGGGFIAAKPLRPSARMQHSLCCQRHMQGFGTGSQYRHFHALFGGLADARGEQRLLLAQIGTHKQHGIVLRQCGNALPQPRRAFEAA